MNAERYIQKELKCIHPAYFAVYNYENKRWEIRKWTGRKHKNPSRYDWMNNSKLIVIVRQEDEHGRDIGYEPLDMRIIKAIKKSNWLKVQWKERLVDKIDRNNERLMEQADAEIELLSRDMAREIYRYYREPRVFLGGN